MNEQVARLVEALEEFLKIPLMGTASFHRACVLARAALAAVAQTDEHDEHDDARCVGSERKECPVHHDTPIAQADPAPMNVESILLAKKEMEAGLGTPYQWGVLPAQAVAEPQRSGCMVCGDAITCTETRCLRHGSPLTPTGQEMLADAHAAIRLSYAGWCDSGLGNLWFDTDEGKSWLALPTVQTALKETQ